MHLNAISYFTLLVSIGLLVDFNMHILVRFLESPCKTREEKVKDSLQTMGSSVVIGGLSTFLGVVPLLFSSSTLMRNLFFGFWGMVIIGCGHGIIVLPVILSYLGPEGTHGVQTRPISDSRRKTTLFSICTFLSTSEAGSREHLDSVDSGASENRGNAQEAAPLSIASEPATGINQPTTEESEPQITHNVTDFSC